jgi:pimeloyl-ACP methyl ester carboxylesterase
MATSHAEQHRVETKSGPLTYHLWRGSGRHAESSDALIVLLHGWLGSATMHFVAGELSMNGHDVAVVDHHTHAGLATLLHPNKQRSVDAHGVTKDAALRTGKHIVHLIDHSNGNQDALHLTEHALKQGAPYTVRAIGAVAGVGMNGEHVHPTTVFAEAAEHISLLKQHPREELQVLGNSLRNYIAHPVLAVEEGIFASRVDCKAALDNLVDTGQIEQLTEVYLDHDRIIPPPKYRNDVIILPGSHMTPVIEPEALRYVAELLAS